MEINRSGRRRYSVVGVTGRAMSTKRRGSVSAQDAISLRLGLGVVFEQSDSGESLSSSSSSSSSEEFAQHVVFLVAANTFSRERKAKLYELLLEIKKTEGMYVYVRAGRALGRMRMSKLASAMEILNQFDGVDYGTREFTTRGEVSYWASRSLSKIYDRIPEDWKGSLNVVLVAAPWAIEPRVLDLMEDEDVNNARGVESVKKLKAFMSGVEL